MKYQVKPYEVPRRRQPRPEVAAVSPKSLPAFSLEAPSDSALRNLLRERYRQQGRGVRSINAINAGSYVIYVESK